MKPLIAIDEFIAGREWTHEQPAHHRYILTIFGLYGRPAGKAIPVAAVVRLLAELGADPSSVRSSISRLKKKGVLVSQKTGRGSGYALFDGLEPHMQAGDARIFSRHSASIGDAWLLVSFSVPESERQKRHKIRTGLARMGFGTVTAGLYIGPVRLQTDVVEYIREHRLWDYVELFICEPSGHGDIQTKVGQWWNLEALASEYQAFVDAYRLEADQWQPHVRDGTGTAREAFKLYIPMVTQWRRLPFLDPGLPPELLPANWIGITARKVFNDLHRLLKPLSAHYFDDSVNEFA
jgi:phenylacetic acid degradation operon negative regulatory protein